MVLRAGGSRDATSAVASDVKIQTDSHAPQPGACKDSGRVGRVFETGRDQDLQRVRSECRPVVRLAPGGSQMIAQTIETEAAPVRLRTLLQGNSVYNVREAPQKILNALKAQAHCRADAVQFTLRGKNSMQLRTELRQQLAKDLASGVRTLAFEQGADEDVRPRADDLEGMVATFPGIERVDWSARPVPSGLDTGLWKVWHARHCKKCSQLNVDDACYFRLLFHFLDTGFEPAIAPGCDPLSAQPSCRAYVDLWRKEEQGCHKAFAKWESQADFLMSPPTKVVPKICFPLLPVVRDKDRWVFANDGTMYKVRLCMDLKNGGLNDMFEDWLFRYVGIEHIATRVQQGDWLAALDISRFYLRLPSGKRLREVLWFQDPATYARCSHDNQARSTRRLRFRQLRAVAFGIKPAPAYASLVSGELTRILESFGVSVAGVYIDDLLIRAKSRKDLEKMLATCYTVCKSLGLDLNDKTIGPCSPSQGIKFLGLIIHTDRCTFSACPRQRAYATDRIRAVLNKGRITLKQLESIAGTLTWISYAMVSGRPRRNQLYTTISRLNASQAPFASVRGQLKRQLSWWFHKLQAPGEISSFFWNVQPDTPAIVSDASGEDGWGACTMGYHIVGHWPEQWKQSAGPGVPSMLYKELVPPVVATILLAPHVRGKVLCGAFDNAGVAYDLNALTAGCPRALTLLRPLADALATNHVHLIAGHAHRVHNAHTDALSHSLNRNLWKQVFASARASRRNRVQLHFAILDIRRSECMLATIAFGQFILPPAGGVAL